MTASTRRRGRLGVVAVAAAAGLVLPAVAAHAAAEDPAPATPAPVDDGLGEAWTLDEPAPAGEATPAEPADPAPAEPAEETTSGQAQVDQSWWDSLVEAVQERSPFREATTAEEAPAEPTGSTPAGAAGTADDAAPSGAPASSTPATTPSAVEPVSPTDAGLEPGDVVVFSRDGITLTGQVVIDPQGRVTIVLDDPSAEPAAPTTTPPAGEDATEDATGRTAEDEAEAEDATAPRTGTATESAEDAPATTEPRRAPSPGTATEEEDTPARPAPSTSTGAAEEEPAGTTTGTQQATPAALPPEVLNLVNQARAEAGCAPLVETGNLTTAAAAHSADLAGMGQLSHVGSDGSTPDTRAGIPAGTRAMAENVAQGQPTPAAVVEAWMASPGHAANILDCELTEVGTAVEVVDGGTWWTQVFAGPAATQERPAGN